MDGNDYYSLNIAQIRAEITFRKTVETVGDLEQILNPRLKPWADIAHGFNRGKLVN